MATFFNLLALRNRPVETIFAATDIAEENRVRECIAATKIQSVARMRQKRRNFVFVRKCIVDMQRVFRGYRGRVSALSKRISNLREHQKSVFDFYAALIQSRWRGYFSRKWIADFYAQKKYIMIVTEKSEQVRRQALEACEKQRLEQEFLRQSQQRAEYDKAMQNMHHLLSTATISGVLRPALSEAGLQTIFSTNIEEDLRKVPIQRRKFKRDLPTSGKIAGATSSSYNYLPLSQPPPPSLQLGTPYEAVKEQQQLEARVNKRQAAVLHKSDFVARKPVPPKPEASLASTEPYVGVDTIRTKSRR